MATRSKTKTSEVLKEFGISNDNILMLAIEPRLLKAADSLIYLIHNKWMMDKITAIQVIESLRKELN